MLVAQAPQEPPPRLLVLISVDQLAEWTYNAARPHFSKNGFLKLEREGTRWTHCDYSHALTLTAPGHATLATGAPPARHGIIGNNWFDRALGKSIYSCFDPEAKTPEGAKSGKELGPAQLLAPTVAEELERASAGAAKTVSVAWKDRAAILMLGRGDLALWIDGDGALTTSTSYAQTLPEWVRALNAPVTPAARFSGTTWTRCGLDAAYSGLVDERSFEPVHGGTRTLPRPVGKPAPAKPDISAVCNSPFALDAVQLCVEAAIEAEHLGADETTDFLAIGYSALDFIGHAFDPTSVEVRDTILRMDQVLARLLAFLDRKVGLDHCLIVLSADHGITPAPEVLRAAGMEHAARGKFTEEFAKLANRTLVEAFGEPQSPHKRFVVAGTAGGLILDKHAIAASGQTMKIACRRVVDAATPLPVFARVIAATDLPEVLARTPAGPERELLQAMLFATHAERGGEVLHVWKDGYIDSTSVASHGSPWPRDRGVPLLAVGRGIPRGECVATQVSPGAAAALFAARCGLTLAPESDPAPLLR